MSFKTDFIEDVEEIKYNGDEISDDAYWQSSDKSRDGNFKCISGDSVFHGDEVKNEVFDEDAQISAPSNNYFVKLIKNNTFFIQIF